MNTRAHQADAAADTQGTGIFTGCGTNTAGKLREVIGGFQLLPGRMPVILADQRVPVRNQVVNRAISMTMRRATVHAASRLDRGVGKRHDLLILMPVSYAYACAYACMLFTSLMTPVAHKSNGVFHKHIAINIIDLSVDHDNGLQLPGSIAFWLGNTEKSVIPGGAETRTKAHGALNARSAARRASAASSPVISVNAILDSRFRGNDKNDFICASLLQPEFKGSLGLWYKRQVF